LYQLSSEINGRHVFPQPIAQAVSNVYFSPASMSQEVGEHPSGSNEVEVAAAS
jgi:hypothetical protein